MGLIRVKGKAPVIDKQKSFSSVKNVNSAVEITDDILALVNGFAIQPLTVEEVFVGKQLLAHNGVDRDLERFPEKILDDFARTLPGKSTLYFHDRNKFLPLGLYFKAETAEMSPAEFKNLTGEDAKLPEGIDTVKVLWAWYYVIKMPDMESVLKNITGGVYRHWSIGFMAASIDAVKNDANGPILYWEYVAPGEATEGSLVWLGAQQGATSQKSLQQKKEELENKPDPGGNKTMKKLIAFLNQKFSKSFSDDTSEDMIVASVKEALDNSESKINELTEEAKGLKTLADVGKAVQEEMVNDYARMKAALGEGDTEDTAHAKLKEFGKSLNFGQLQQEVKHLKTRMEKAFPDSQLDGDDPGKNRGKGKKNVLIPDED